MSSETDMDHEGLREQLDELLQDFGLWLMGQRLLKNMYEEPADRRSLSQLVKDFRGER
ncbi:hypothetical protein [Mycolicibacter minnesotensis]|uniref:hypothetical protein n=1 Tax=Mycolicibacter minnesotensis TaxID=1118379 RepID=UPI00138C7E9D|nr:hypothetical protein [Mycolicibacter minnesotensis]BBY34928.1 hypothetical protein MMIN_29890 [Mycolicibacter minnesotensis]